MDQALERFSHVVRQDPLFAAEGMDIENASAALDEIERGCGLLETAYANGSFARRLFFLRYPLSRFALPLEFLRAFIRSESLRRAFVANGGREAAMDLVQSWSRCAEAYVADLNRYRNFHEIIAALEPTSKHDFIMEDYFGSRTSYRRVLKQIDALLKNGVALKQEVAARDRMLRTGEGPALDEHAETKSPEISLREASEVGKRIHKAEQDGGISPFRYADVIDSYGPFGFVLEQFDGKPAEHVFMWYLLKDRKNQLRSSWLSVLSRHAFADLWSPRDSKDSVARSKFASAIGISQEEMPYWYEPLAHFYNTRDLGYWIDIATSIDLIKRPGLDQRLVRNERASTFDLLLSEGARDMKLIRSHQVRRNLSGAANGFSKLFELVSRTYPYLYYQVFNGSVQRLPQPSFRGDVFAPTDRGRLSETQIRDLPEDVLSATLSASRLREERGIQRGWF